MLGMIEMYSCSSFSILTDEVCFFMLGMIDVCVCNVDRKIII